MNKPAKKRFGSSTLNQPVAAATPDELMFGPLGSPSNSIGVGLPSQPPGNGPTGRWVPFGSYIRDQTYLQLKQAEYWEPGFEIRQFLEDTLQTALTQLSASQRELPAPVLEKLLKTNRKLRAD